MNYQFTKSYLGVPEAQFEMGNEAFSRWFSEELGVKKTSLTKIFTAIEQLENGKINQFTLTGNEFSLLLDKYEVEVSANELHLNSPDELPEGTEIYTQELVSGCGLEDFKQVLKSWSDFIAE